MSSGLRRLVSAFDLKDSHKLLHPRTKDYSRYYKNDKYGSGATRIDRIYIYGGINVSKSQYIPISWSDHLALVSSYRLPDSLAKNSSVKSKPVFKISPNVIDDNVFQDQLRAAVSHWTELRSYYSYSILQWWEYLVKPGIRKLAITRSKEIKKSRRGRLNFLNMYLLHLTLKMKDGDTSVWSTIKDTQTQINKWFEEEADKIKLQSGIDDITLSEKVLLYHHELHKKHIKRSLILELATEDGTV